MKKSAKNAQNLSIITNIRILRIAEPNAHLMLGNLSVPGTVREVKRGWRVTAETKKATQYAWMACCSIARYLVSVLLRVWWYHAERMLRLTGRSDWSSAADVPPTGSAQHKL
ncbi:MAG: hypothetical protein ACRDCM_11005, partial [Plesiomonas shigelloides]